MLLIAVAAAASNIVIIILKHTVEREKNMRRLYSFHSIHITLSYRCSAHKIKHNVSILCPRIQ